MNSKHALNYMFTNLKKNFKKLKSKS